MNNYVECQKCGDHINVDTNSILTWCSCGTIGVDGNEHYCRILGGNGDWKVFKDGKEVSY